VSAVRERPFEAGGIRTVLAEAGPADACDAIVYVHGNPGAALDWHDLMSRTGEFARSIAFDMPGFGRADKPRDLAVPVAGFAAFLDAALRELGVERAHLVLHDFGGPWGLAWAATHQDAWASVVLMNTGVLVGFEAHRAGRLWGTPVVGELVMLATTRRAWRRAFADTGVPPGVVDRMYDHYDRATRRLVRRRAPAVGGRPVPSARQARARGVGRQGPVRAGPPRRAAEGDRVPRRAGGRAGRERALADGRRSRGRRRGRRAVPARAGGDD